MAGETVSVPVLSQSAAPVGSLDVPAAVVAGPVREHLLHAAVRAQLASRRSGTATTKTRGMVSGGGKKPWRQKGTGRARAGSTRSPLWAGGAVIFGPQPRDYGHRLPRGARRAALRAAVASRHTEGALIVVDELRLPEPRTKRMLECLAALGVAGESVLIVLAEANASTERAARNLPRVKVLRVGGMNVYDVLRHRRLVMERPAFEQLVARLSVGGHRGAEGAR